MSKVLVYTDIHHSTARVGRLGVSGLDLRLEDTLEIERKITQYCLDKGIKIVIFAGDRCDSRNPPSWLVNLIDSVWKERLEHGIEMYVDIGNHDTYRLSTRGKDTYSSLWKDYKSVMKISDRPNMAKIYDRLVAFLPFGYDIKVFSKNGKDKFDILIFHDEIRGFKDGRGYIGRSGIELSVLRKCAKLVVGGHIHAHGEIGAYGVYVGCPYQKDKLDAGKPRGFIVIDFKDLSWEFIELDAPQLVLIKIRDLDAINQEAIRGNYVFCETIQSLSDKVKELLIRYRARHFVITILKEGGFMVEQIAREVYRSEEIENVLKEYVSSRQVALVSDGDTREELVDMGLDIWRDTSSV